MDDLVREVVPLAGLYEGPLGLAGDAEAKDGALGNARGHLLEFLLVEEDLGCGFSAPIDDGRNAARGAEPVEFALRGLDAGLRL